ncbi:MAG: ATP-dependent Clp protease ATP-binding subunit [Sorangiineae bacterium PRO1]|nr:ATP-dependent Clp protease ATP-binding subunit [Sorangiineae bacterium PRO1]
MSVQASLSIYQAKHGNLIRMTPVCPGLFEWTTLSRDAGKAKERCVERARREAEKLEPALFSRLSVPAGRKLERVYGELKLSHEGEKRHVAGWFPVVTELRRSGADAELRIAYHPLSPRRWFAVDPDGDFGAQVLEAYARVLDPGAELDLFKSNGSDKLVTARFDVTPQSLLSLLAPKPDPSEALGVGASARLEELLRVSVNHTARAAEGRLHTGLPRSGLRQRLAELLSGSSPAPVLVVGPSGSGKSTLIAQAVADLLEADDFPFHRNLDRCHVVMGIRGRHLIAGMSYVGQWEARAVALLERAKKKRWILNVDDVCAWGNIGRTVGSERSLADFFRGPLARRELGFVGECTPAELSVLEHEAPGFASVFTRVTVEPVPASAALSMLLHESRRLERQHELEIDPRAYRRVLDLGQALSSGSEPGRSLSALSGLVKSFAARADADESEAPRQISPDDVVAWFSRQTGLPDLLLGSDPPLSAETLRRELGQQIMGQPVALDAAVDLVLSLRAGITARGRPYGVYLFTGPTGTGKTELAKCIAEYLYGDTRRLCRFDMGEHGGADAVSRLLGDRFSPEGTLTRAVRAQPFSVLLFDEIEKAHPAVLNLMLQVFDDGRLTDARGTVADFSHSVIVLTSNLGSGKRSVRGFLDDPGGTATDVARAVREFFPPELFNRIDRVVPFEPLDRAAAKDIARKELAKLAARPGLSERNVFVRYTDAVVESVVSQGYSVEYGARSLKRHIDRHVGDELGRAVTRERSAEMRLFWLYRQDGSVKVHAEALREAEAVELAPGLVEGLFGAGPSQLSARLVDALPMLRELRGSSRLGEIQADISRELGELRLGDGTRADQVFNLDALAAHVSRLVSRLERRTSADEHLQAHARLDKRRTGEELTGEDYTTLADAFGKLRQARNQRERLAPPRTSLSNRQSRQLLSDLAELGFVERLIASRGRPDRHAVRLDLTRLAAHHESRRFSRGNPGLLEWLSRAYAGARGELESAAARYEDGSERAAASRHELHALLESRPRQLSLRVVGPGVSDFFAGERGCHVRRAEGAGPEIVRVSVVPGGGAPRELLAEHAARARAFERALEGDGPLPENPESILPVVRSVRWSPVEGRPSVATVLDYRLAHVVSVRVRELGDALSELWLLGMAGSEA